MSYGKKYAVVGTGGRSGMYIQALTSTHKDDGQLVGMCDCNAGRLSMMHDWVKNQGLDIPIYTHDQFDRMIYEQKPDCVIVTTKDSAHDEYICRAMEFGCDAITEKPMTIDAGKCQHILDTQKGTGKKCIVTFNCRYSPLHTQIKELLMSGIIGKIVSIDFHWMLDTSHGADYFRRWHRNKANSGGLLVHKATHHFDLVNWWIESVPETVYATGKRSFYTPQTAKTFGLSNRSERCLDCPESSKCRFYLDMKSNEGMRRLYLDNEQYDGYIRDACVFSDKIDIEDTMNLTVRYQNKVTMSYSLNAFMPLEGYVITFNGMKGRLEHKYEETVNISNDDSLLGTLKKEGSWIRVYPHFEPAYQIEASIGVGGHGGGDERLLDDLFNPNPQDDKYMRAADYRAGAFSALTGIAANTSIATGKVVRISNLVEGLELPDYP
ncbi:Gfo/Idh/MocA family oxidoreductase [uncultured Desulfobulbus sp.]|uniref:Gfo/Idh/MocA family protein n=1 Tax=uncultured Desulfobulbus sp. TaxID=239745 RepID=UPI0029C76F07|nr:Gfo/Idh/MocA family oxidoreductase [uncultured Desulfobulbus sp.]